MLNCEASHCGKDDDLWLREARVFAQVQLSVKRSEMSFVSFTVHFWGLLTVTEIFLLFTWVQIVSFF